MAKIFWSVGDLFMYQDPTSPVRKSYGVVSSMEDDCYLVTDTGLRTRRYNLGIEFIPDGAVPLAPAERRSIPLEVKMALEMAGLAVGVKNFCTRD